MTNNEDLEAMGIYSNEKKSNTYTNISSNLVANEFLNFIDKFKIISYIFAGIIFVIGLIVGIEEDSGILIISTIIISILLIGLTLYKIMFLKAIAEGLNLLQDIKNK